MEFVWVWKRRINRLRLRSLESKKMKITKYGHCCLKIEISTKLDSGERNVCVLTDPGTYTEAQNNVTGIDIIVITHEHPDHYHIDSVRKVLKNNPDASIITNTSVNNLLIKEGVPGAKIVLVGEQLEEKGIIFKGFGKIHALIHKEWNSVENTGYFIGDRLFYPGDALTLPFSSAGTSLDIDILALPVSGPWLKISEAIDLAIATKPKVVFPVHDGMLNELGGGVIKRVVPMILEKHGIKFQNLEIGVETEI